MTSLPILLIEAHSRCNCRCEMCDIWKSADAREFSLAQLEAQLNSIQRLGTRWVVFTGGEPLMHSGLFALCAPLRARGIEVSILSTGLLFERYAAQITQHLDSAIVSIDGPPAVHDRIRHTAGGFDLLARGIRAIHTLRPDFPISARTVVQKRNHALLTQTAAAVKDLGLKSISFLAADLASHAFNRAEPWPVIRQNEIALSPAELPALDQQLAALALDSFVIDSPRHLQRIAQHFRAHLGLEPHTAPRCNAPEVSAVIGADGLVQPCFFHPSIGSLNGASLFNVLNSPPAVAFRESLDVATNATCQRCVCSLYLQ
ncbi:MAG: radical SAM protein [Acidobacteriota bacterium]